MLHLCCPSRSSQQSWWQRAGPPCCLLWPGEQCEGCERLIPLRCWQLGPLSKPGEPFLHRAGSLLTAVGNPGPLTTAEPSPRALTGTPLWGGEYYLHCRALVVFVVSEDEPGGCPTEGRPRRWRSCVNAAAPGFVSLIYIYIFFYKISHFLLWHFCCFF